MALSGVQDRGFAHNALTLDQIDRAAPVGDPPMARDQLQDTIESFSIRI
jgi:hypothetical protein